ncbi:MAG: hypothetical protein QG622_808 [Actinomycetota bacterium]|nr:hypothetical protein [Actinomycetota bacterium]
MRVVSYGHGGTDGHSFLLINNIDTLPHSLVGMTVAVGGEVSVGTWGNKPDGKGVYFNLERHFGPGAYPGRVSLEMNLTSEQLSTVSKRIVDNNSWALANNCSSFATKVWNSVATVKVKAGTPNTPAKLTGNIKTHAGWVTNTGFSALNDDSQVFALEGKGSRKNVSSGTLTSGSTSA